MPTQAIISEEVLATFERAPDLELHIKRHVVSVQEGEEITLLSLREYVPSRKLYGRGILFPEELAYSIAEVLDD